MRNLKLTVKVNNVWDLYRGINDFKKGYQPRTVIVKDEKGELFAGGKVEELFLPAFECT